jgi:hypothetical protein
VAKVPQGSRQNRYIGLRAQGRAPSGKRAEFYGNGLPPWLGPFVVSTFIVRVVGF